MVVHRDKLKPCLSETPASWIRNKVNAPDDGNHGDKGESVEAVTSSHTRLVVPSSPPDVAFNSQNASLEDIPQLVNERPKRVITKPSRLSDFICGVSLQQRESVMAQVQVAYDYGTRTCVLCLTHCAS